MPLWHYRNNRTLIRLSRVEGTEGRERRLIELVRHSSVAEGAQIETRPKPGWCFDLFCLCFVPDPPYVLADNQSCLPFDFDLVPLPSLSLFLSLFGLSLCLSISFNRPSPSDALVHQPGQNASLWWWQRHFRGKITWQACQVETHDGETSPWRWF